MPGTMYPPGPPTVSGNLITVETFLNSPTRVQRVVDDLTLNRFLADQIFSQGGAAGGAVVYDQIASGEFFTTRDVQGIAPGSQFPIIDTGEAVPKVARVIKWGGAAVVTYEAVRRDNRDVLNRQLTKLRNTIIRKVDTVAIAALDAALPTMPASASWALATTDIITDLEMARAAIDDADLGYEADTVIINPTQRIGVRKNTGLRNALPREGMANNLIGARDLNGLLGFRNWFVSNRQPAGTVKVLASRIVGSIRDELGLYTRTIDEPVNERWLVQGARVTVPIITDPLAGINVTGA